MTTILDFVKITKLEGLKGFFLVKNDGTVVAHKGEDTESVSPVIALSGLNCIAIQTVLELEKFKYMIFSRSNKENVLIFPMRSYFLGIIKESDASTPDLIAEIKKFFGTIQNKHTVSQNN